MPSPNGAGPLADLRRYGTLVEPSPVFLPTIKPIRFPEPEDPESFYYDWTQDEAVTIGMLTCEFWRHQNAAEVFEFVVQFTGDGQVSGSVECTVEASNLTAKVTSRILVQRQIQQIDVFALASRMANECE